MPGPFGGADSWAKTARLVPLTRSARTIVEKCLALQPGETVAIVTDTEVSPLISLSIAGAVVAAGGAPVVLMMEPLIMPGAEPPEPIAAAMAAADAVINCCSRSISHTQARHRAQYECGRRYLIMSEATEDILLNGASTADFEEVKAITTAVVETLSAGDIVRVTSDQGTDITFSIDGRRPKAMYGEAHEPGTNSIFPGGETPLCPVEDTAEGRIVVDTFMMEVGLLREPIVWEVRGGEVVEIAGGVEADQLRRLLDTTGDEYSRKLAEFSIGTNPAARFVGSAMEDKQVYGSVHFGIGTGVSNPPYYTNKYRSRTHVDGVLRRPTVELDGRTIMSDGEIHVASLPRGRQRVGV